MEKEDRDYLRKFRGTMIPFLLVLGIFGLLSYWVTRPVMAPILWASLLSAFSYPLFEWIHRRIFRERNRNAAAFCNTCLVVLVLVLPTVFMGSVLVREGVYLYGIVTDYLRENPSLNFHVGDYLPEWFLNLKQNALLEEYAVSFENSLRQGMRWGATSIAGISRDLLGNAFAILYQIVFAVVATFFLTRDGHVILGYLKDITPLGEKERELFFLRAKKLLRSIVYGIIFTAGIQAFLGTLGWSYFDLPAPLIFGALMFVLAMIPIVGTSLVLLPGAAYLFFTGHHVQGVVLAVYSMVAVSSIESFVRPLFISEGSQVHALIVIIGIVGGLATWGVLGLFLGPLVVSLFIFFLDGYRRIETIRRGKSL